MVQKEIVLLLEDPSESMAYGVSSYILSLSTADETLQIPPPAVYLKIFSLILSSPSAAIKVAMYSLLVQLHRIHPLHSTPELWSPSHAIDSPSPFSPTCLQLLRDIASTLTTLADPFLEYSSSSSPSSSSSSPSSSSSCSSSSSAQKSSHLHQIIASIDKAESFLSGRFLLLRYYLVLFEDQLDHVYKPVDYAGAAEQACELWHCFADLSSPAFAGAIGTCFEILNRTLSQRDAFIADIDPRRSKRNSRAKAAEQAEKEAEEKEEEEGKEEGRGRRQLRRMWYEARYLVGALLNLASRIYNAHWTAPLYKGHAGVSPGKQFLERMLSGYARLPSWDAKIEFVTGLEEGSVKLDLLDLLLSDHKMLPTANKSLRGAPLSLEKISGLFFHIEPHLDSKRAEDAAYVAQSNECRTLLLSQLMQGFTDKLVERGERVGQQFVDETERYVKKMAKSRGDKAAGNAGLRAIHAAHVILMTAKLMLHITKSALETAKTDKRPCP